jgi:hypothetical protein
MWLSSASRYLREGIRKWQNEWKKKGKIDLETVNNMMGCRFQGIKVDSSGRD